MDLWFSEDKMAPGGRFTTRKWVVEFLTQRPR